MQTPTSLDLQRRLLRSLGFGFLEEPAPGYQPHAPEAPSPTTHAPSADTRPAKAHLSLDALAAAVRACTDCPLHYTRRCAVPGEGVAGARVLFIGESPGTPDNESGMPFRGELDEMLNNMIKAMGLSRQQVYLTHAVKCQPPGGRGPQAPELDACGPYLANQVALIRPSVIVCFGVAGLQSLLPGEAAGGLTRSRGKWLSYQQIPLLPTFALPYILRNTERKKIVWGDLQIVMARLADH